MNFVNNLRIISCHYSIHENCKKYTAVITKSIENNEIADFNLIFENLIYFLSKNVGCMYTNDIKNLIDKIKDLIDIELLTRPTIDIIRSLNYEFIQIVRNNIDKLKHISSGLFNNILLLQNKDFNDYLIYSKLDIIDIASNHIELLCSNPGLTQKVTSLSLSFLKDGVTQYNANYIIELAKKNPNAISKNAIIFAILGNHKLDLIENLINKKNFQLDQDYLIASCFKLNKQYIEYFLNKKIEINHSCLKGIFSHIIQNDFLQIPAGFITFFNNSYPKYNFYSAQLAKDIINIFQKYNYIFTYNDAVLLLQHNVEIPSFENYNITIDDNFVNLCEIYNYYPNYGKKINDIKAIKLFTNYNNLSIIKSELSRLKFTPTQECLYNACELKTNTTIIKYLLSLGLKIDEKCLQLSGNIISRKSSTFALVLSEFMKNIKIPNQDDKIKKLEDRIKELEKELENSTSNTPNMSHTKIIIKKKDIKKDIEKEMQYHYLDEKIKIKKEAQVDKEFIKFFNLDNLESDTINCLFLKKILLKYFKEKKLIKKNSFEIILDESLIKVLKFDKKYGNLIDLKDLDEFCKFILSNIE
jgi:hypothetical protein